MPRKENRRLAQARTLDQEQKGLGLVEALVAVALLGTSVVAFAIALSAGSIAVGEHDEESVAQRLAQTQVEYTKSYPYNPGAGTYPAVAAPAGYALSIGVSSVPGSDVNIQKVTVTVMRGGVNIFSVSDYKVNR
jgi:Tfp pilus assembly protein PilV